MADSPTPEDVTHRCPPEESGIMPCCGRTPFERRGDRITTDPRLVTCGKAEPALHPTEARMRLMREIADGKVVEYTTETPPLIFSPTEDRAVTARVVELAAAGLVTRDTTVHIYFKIPALTAAGEAWLDTHGKNGADT